MSGLTKDEEYALIANVQNNDCRQSLAQLLKHYDGFLAKRASKYHKKYGFDFNELKQEASIGFIKAVERFDFDKGVRLATYASWWMMSELKIYVQQNRSIVTTPHSPGSKISIIEKAYYAFIQERGNSPSVVPFTKDEKDAFYKEHGITFNEFFYEMSLKYGDTDSLDAPLQQEEDKGQILPLNHLESALPSPSAALEKASDKSYLEHLLEQAPLNDRERHIVKERHYSEENVTLEDLSQEFDVSRERIRQIEVAALKKLKRHASQMKSDLSRQMQEAGLG